MAAKKIVVDGVTTRILGVLPADFETPDLTPADLLVPQRLPPGPNNRNVPVTVVGRLRPGQTAASAATTLAGPLDRFRAEFATRNHLEAPAQATWLHIEPLRDRQSQAPLPQVCCGCSRDCFMKSKRWTSVYLPGPSQCWQQSRY